MSPPPYLQLDQKYFLSMQKFIDLNLFRFSTKKRVEHITYVDITNERIKKNIISKV